MKRTTGRYEKTNVTGEEIRAFVTDRQRNLTDALARLKDKSEFGVRGGCDLSDLEEMCFSSSRNFDAVFSSVSSSIAEIVRDSISSDDPQAGIEAIIQGFSDRIHGALSEISTEAIHKANAPSMFTDEGEVILNGTYLVTIVDEKNFKAKVAELAREFAACGVSIEVSGPWPPYHFVELNLGGDSATSQSEIPV